MSAGFPCWSNVRLAVLGLGCLLTGVAQAATEITRFSLEELMAMEITSVAKKAQPLSEAAAAVHVITREDIRRSGMTSIPELLRMVPGLHVARIDASKWAISARGFNGRWANKLLVLMDGRSLYTPLFSGVYWDVQDTPLDDIERIEVVRGPGGTLWGANAVNGVINIITRHSRDTLGGLAAALAGDWEKSATLRYGHTLGEVGWIRAYAKAADYDGSLDADGDPAHDAWDIQRAGFRADWGPSSRDALTLQGDLYRGNAERTVGDLENLSSPLRFQQDTADLSGGNLLFRWHRGLDEKSEWELQAYFDRTERDDLSLDQRIDTFDVDFRHRFPLTERHEITWGLGYRRTEDDLHNSFTVSFHPASRDLNLYSAFIQDEINLRNDLRLTLGTKIEHNHFTGFEYQPSVRLLWIASDKHSLWGAVSRAVRTPSRSDGDIRINVAAFTSPVDPDGPGALAPGDPTLLSIFGADVRSEELLSFELGYRGRPHRSLSLDAAAFYNRYDNLLTSERSFGIESEPALPHALIASTFDNRMEGESYGLELGASWQGGPDWRLYAGYSLLKVVVQLDTGSTDTVNVANREDSSPEHQLQLRSHWDIRDNLELDLSLYYVDRIAAHNAVVFSPVPSYVRLDARLAWQPRKDVEISLVAQNILDDRHAEFLTTDVVATEVPRSLYGQIKVLF